MRSKFNYYDLGQKGAGEVVEVSLSGSAANVRLMDSSNFYSYQSGRQHRYVGGLAKKSPIRLPIPHSGHWYVTVDMQGLRGSVRSSIRMIPRPLPELREVPISSVPSLLHGRSDHSGLTIEDDDREFDVFISHATEDKDEVVRPLAVALRSMNLRVWYDEFELRIGDSLRRKIDMGLARSRFGIIVFSKLFLSKGWTNYEVDGIVTRSVTGEQVLLPIWHNVTKAEMVEYSPSLADKLARSTSTHTVQEIAKEIADVVNGDVAIS